MSINKVDSPDPVIPGDNITYTLTYSNATAGTETATNVVITEAYDPNVTFVSANPAPDTGTDNQWTIGDLSPGGSGTIEVTVVVVDPSLLPLPNDTQLLNYVEISSNQVSASAEQVTTVKCHEIPTVDQWGMLILTLLIGWAAIYSLRTRKKV